MKFAQPLSILACCVIAIACDDDSPNVGLKYPPGATQLAAANLTVTVPVNTPTTAIVPVLNPRSDLVVTVLTAPAHGTLTTTTTLLGLLYTPNTDYLGEDSAVVVIAATGDSTIQLRSTITFNVQIPFAIVAPDGITAQPAISFAFTGDSAITITHSAADDLVLIETLTTDLGTLTLGNTTGITFAEDADGATSDGVDDTTIVFSGDLAAVNAALASLTLHVESGTDLATTGTLTIASDDGALDSFGSPRAPQMAAVDIVLSAAPPVPLTVSGPSSQTTNEDTALVFSAGNGNRLILTDDQGAAASSISVELNAQHGTVTLASSSDLTFTQGNGTGGAQLHFSGQKSAVLAAIATVTFTPDANFNGSNGQLVFKASSPTGSDTLTIAVSVSAVNDAPTITMQDAPSVVKGGTITYSGNNAFALADVDAANNQSMTFVCDIPSGTNAGTWALPGPPQGLAANVTNAGRTITIQGTISNLNAGLSSLTWTPPNSNAFSVNVTCSLNDNGSSGSGGSKTGTLNFQNTETN